MAQRNMKDQFTEAPREARQAEKSKYSLGILSISMIAAIVLGCSLVWYFGALTETQIPAPVQTR